MTKLMGDYAKLNFIYVILTAALTGALLLANPIMTLTITAALNHGFLRPALTRGV